jgi:oligo-1,6-glucosidase
LGKYYLHQFAREQPDLNWQNPALRAEIYDMMNWWLDRGVGGFRMDVIDLIGKDIDSGAFAEGPDLHLFLKEMHSAALAGRDVLTVGETWSVTPDSALLYCGQDSAELDMVFQFAHVLAGHHPTLGKWAPLPRDLPRLKRSFFDWQEALASDGWNALFLSNHDLPRQVSKYGDDGPHRVASAKALALVLHLLKGTPFVYQGEEIGMTNAAFTRMDQFRDVETFGQYDKALADGLTEAEFIAGANENGRDNARTPMQWTGGAQAGFTTDTPWIDVNPNHTGINAAADSAEADGIMAFYRSLIAMRRAEPILTLGAFQAVSPDHPRVFAYTRQLGDQRLSVLVNMSDETLDYDPPVDLQVTGRCVASTRTTMCNISGPLTLEPYDGWAILSAGYSAGT